MFVCLLLILSPACLLVCLSEPCLAVFNLIKNGSPILIRLANGAEFAGRLPNLHIKSINCYYCCCSRDSRLETGNTEHSVDRQSNLAGCCCWCCCFCSGPTPIAPELCLISKVVKQTNSSGTKCSDRERESEWVSEWKRERRREREGGGERNQAGYWAICPAGKRLVTITMSGQKLPVYPEGASNLHPTPVPFPTPTNPSRIPSGPHKRPKKSP